MGDSSAEPEPADRAAMQATLQQVFGYRRLRAEQEQVVRHLLDGRSALAVLPTGAGKSLCYQLPALLREGVALVISPLLALMKDQVDSLLRRGVAAARWDSTLMPSAVEELKQRIGAGQVKLLYIAPERLVDPEFERVIAAVRLSMIAVDEAHCVVEWGHQFRPDYLKVARWCRQQDVPILAVTATATPAVLEELRRCFAMEAWGVVRTSVRRENLQLQVSCAAASEAREWLLQRMRETPGAKIVYVNWQQSAEAVATWLLSQKIVAQAYHAGLPVELKREIQERFIAGELEVMVATMAFGMGVDKADVRGVFHYQLPKSLEQYAQEVGRAGRDGQAARCDMLLVEEDIVALRNRQLAQDIPEGALLRLIDRTLRCEGEIWVSFAELALSCDVEEQRLKMLFALMEQEGVLERIGSRHAVIWLRPLRRIEQIVAGETAVRQMQWRRLWQSIAGPRQRWKVEVELEAERLGLRADELTEQLQDLCDAGDVSLTRSALQHGYRVRAPQGRLREWAAAFEQRMLITATHEQQRLEQVVAFARASSGCWSALLQQHFGEVTTTCPGCASCVPSGRAVGITTSAPEIDAASWDLLRSLRHSNVAALRTTRQRARFLCGLSSPALRRAKLTTAAGFGSLAAHDFRHVCTWLEE